MEKVLWALAVAAPIICLFAMRAVEEKPYRPHWERDNWRRTSFE